MERAAAAPPAVVPDRPAPAATATPAVVSPLKIDRRPVDEVSRFSTARFEASGLAYDAVSGRFLLGDSGGRRVMVLGDGSSSVVDYALAVSAGFHDVRAFAIDTTRGDLWVASSAADGSKGAVHRLQLISGRAISMVESPQEWRNVDLVDLAIADATTILALDRAGSRLVVSRPGAKALTEIMPLQLVDAVSLTTSDPRTAYATYRDGIVRLDLQQRTATPVAAAAGIFLGGLERIRWHRSGLIGVQNLPDGTRQIVRLEIARGRVSAATVLDDTLPRNAGPALATLAGDDLYYLTQDASAGAQVNFVVKRVRLAQ